MTQAQMCLDRVNSAINHARDFAPEAPLERFLAQEIAVAVADAFAMAGWYSAAEVWRAAVEELGDIELQTRVVVASDYEGIP